MLALLLFSVSVLALAAFDNEGSIPDDSDNTVEGKATGFESVSLHDGNDAYHAHNSDHIVYAGRGDDTYIMDKSTITASSATMWGSSGNDTMIVTTEAPSDVALYGGSGNDYFYVDSDADVQISGGRGDDIVDLYTSATVDGGADKDTYIIHSDNNPDKIPSIIFEQGSDNLVLELSGFKDTSIVEYLLDYTNKGIAGTTITVDSIPVVYLVNESGQLESAVHHLSKHISFKFMEQKDE